MSKPETTAPVDASTVSVFAALGDQTRLELIMRLSDGHPKSIVQLTEGTGLTRQAVTKHLKVLSGAGVVASHREGRETQFVFQPTPLLDAQAYLANVSDQWDRTLARLKRLVEKEPE